MTQSDLVLVDEPAPGLRRIRLNRPQRRNALTLAMATDLVAALARPAPPVLVLGSTDARAFCAGGDLSSTPADLGAVSDLIYAALEQVVTLDSVIIAAVEGAAIGGGAHLLIGCDIAIAGPSASIGFLGAQSGMSIGTWRLPELVGVGVASELILTGRRVDAAEALRIGLVHRLEPDPMAAAMDLATTLAAADPQVLARAKSLTRRAATMALLQRERAENFGRHPAVTDRSPR